ncbi:MULTISPECIES: hypothetical protein [unclassified Streptomyces]
MVEPPSRPYATGHGPDPAAHPGMPRWAKAFAIAVGAALLVAVVLMHTLGGNMGNH